MGIPSFFRNIIQKDANIIFGSSVQNFETDYFYIDFNSIIYNTFHKLDRTSPQIESILIQEIIKTLQHLINDIVKPKKYAYISIDGVAPRAKMVQQRSRRYKSLQLKQIFAQIENNVSNHEWDPASNICPGTKFMLKLQESILNHLSTFQYKTFLNDSNHVGEGEHKFLSTIRKLKEYDHNIVIYSPDGDMISLSLLTHKSKIYIMRIPDAQSPIESRFIPQEEYIYCNCDLIRELFYKELTKTFQNDIQELNVLTDYNFLLFMVGNDFIPSLPFLKIRSGGLDLLIRIYNQIRPLFNDYLIFYDFIQHSIPQINMPFFKEIIIKLSQYENNEMNREYSNILNDSNHHRHDYRLVKEKEMSEIDIFKSRFQHLSFFHPDHPHYQSSIHLLNTIQYKEPKNTWKSQYYQYFCQFSVHDVQKYNQEKIEMVKNYFESLMFTLYYYLNGCPSKSWYYKYRVSPLPSDMFYVLDKLELDLNQIQFTDSLEYTPFVQLLLILPPQMSFLLPKVLQEYFNKKEYYLNDFQVDKLAGIKYIYCEAILPEMNDEEIIHFVKSKEKFFTDLEKKQNQLHQKLFSFKLQSSK